VQWYDTHGEQFHTKLLAFHTARGTTLLGGSANLTRRNLGDYNLEADLLVRAGEGLAA
jgi:HKD family nuclease